MKSTLLATLARPRAAAALALVVGANLLALAAVAWNRLGPGTEVVLSPRELTAQVRSDLDDSSATLRLQTVQVPWFEALREPAADSEVGVLRIDAARLRALGFDTSLPPEDRMAARHYGTMLPRPVFVCYEVGGPVWERWQARQRAEAEERFAVLARRTDLEPGVRDEQLRQQRRQLEQDLAVSSRLLAIDIDRDRAALAARCGGAGRFMLRASVRPTVHSDGARTALDGILEGTLERPIAVPAALRAAASELEQLWAERWAHPADAPEPYRFPERRIVLRIGARLEPETVAASR